MDDKEEFDLESILAEFNSPAPIAIDDDKEALPTQQEEQPEKKTGKKGRKRGLSGKDRKKNSEEASDLQPEPQQDSEPRAEKKQGKKREKSQDVDDKVYTDIPSFVPEPMDDSQSLLSELLNTEKALGENEGDINGDPFEPLPTLKPKPREWEGEAVTPTPQGGMERKVKKKRKKDEQEPIVYEDSMPLPRAVKSYSKKVRSLWPRMMLGIPITVIAVYITLASAFGLPELPFIGSVVRNCILIGINIIMLALCYDLIAQALLDIIDKRFTLELAAVLVSVVAIVHGFLHLKSETPGFTGNTSLVLLLCLIGSYCKKSAIRRSLRNAMASGTPKEVICQKDGFEGVTGYFKRNGNPEGFTAMSEADSCWENAYRLWGLIFLGVAVAGAVAVTLLKKTDFMTNLAAFLCAALPAAGAMSFAMPYSYLSKRLNLLGAALGGWPGACRLKGDGAIIITDKDLFPGKSVSIEGLRMFGSFSSERVVGYSAALISAGGCGLEDIFIKAMEQEKVSMPTMGVFQTYEGGGLSAEIKGDLVFMGTSSFMALQNIKIPVGAKVNNGVYVAINGQLAGLFVINYKPLKKVADTFTSLFRCRGLRLVMATRDFNITPSFMRQKYGVNCDNIDVPTIEGRVQLSDEEIKREGDRAAIISKDGLAPFGDVVVGGKRLRIIALFNTVFSLIGSGVGVALLIFLGIAGASTALVPGYSLLYSLAFAIPVMLISTWAERY